MKLLLVFPPRRFDSYMHPPTSLLYITQAVRRAGHEAEIIDIPYLLEKFPEKYALQDNSIAEYILSKDCDLLGLAGLVSTYFFYDDFIPKFRAAKKDIPIVVGGSVGSPIKEVWEEHNPVDYLIESDGEISIQRLMDCLEERDYDGVEKIPGLHYLKNGRYERNAPEAINDIDKIPFLSYDEIDHEYYITELSRWLEDIIPDKSMLEGGEPRFLPLLTSRGCPYVCTFCFHFNSRMNFHSADYIVGYIKFLKEKYRINGLYVIDDLFVVDKKRTIRLCERLHKEDLGVVFFGSGGKPGLVGEKVLGSMKRAGFIRFSYGIESGSQKILDVMVKETTVEQNIEAVQITENNNVPCFANILFGMPGEDIQTLNETRDFLIKIGLNTSRFYASWAVAYPGTPLFDWMKENNLVGDTREYLFKVGSIGRYVHNFSDLPLSTLEHKVFELHREVDMAYHLKHKEYKSYLIKFTELVFGKLLYSLNPALRQKIKNCGRKNILGSEGQKRSQKKSTIEVEQWVASLSQKADANVFAPPLETTAAPHEKPQLQPTE
mgnify:FL=1